MDDGQKKKIKNEAGPYRIISKKDAAHIQVLTACSLLAEGQWECAITLAGAAEGQLEEVENAKVPNLFSMIKKLESRTKFKSEREYISFVNRLRDWLKHSGDQRDMLIRETEAIAMVARAVTKYYQVYDDSLEELKDFADWAKGKGFGSGFPELTKRPG
jgi:hypothetical protein